MAWVPSPAEKLPHTLDMAIKKKKNSFLAFVLLGLALEFPRRLLASPRLLFPLSWRLACAWWGKDSFFFFFNRDLNDFLLKFS